MKKENIKGQDFRQRQRVKNIVMALFIIALCILFYTISILKCAIYFLATGIWDNPNRIPNTQRYDLWS